MAPKRSWFWLLFGFALVVVLFSAAIWLMNRVFLGSTPSLESANVLEVRLAGEIVERPSTFWSDRPIGALSVREIDRTLRRAANDRRIRGVVLRVGPLVTGFAKAQEIRDAIHAFRASGKPVVALVEIGTILDLYVASAADQIVQIPTGNLILGLVSRTQYYRDLLDKLGVEFEAFHTGPYKTAMNPYTETEMSADERAQIESLLDSIYQQLLVSIAEDRDLSVQQVESGIDRGLLSAVTARDIGLIDHLGFADGLDEILGTPGLGRVSLRDYWDASGSSGGGWRSPVIAIVHVSGMIVPGDIGDSLFGSGALAGGDAVARHLRQAREDSEVRAVVLRIDSPGGVVSASDVIWREAALTAEAKPLIVSMSDVAASGGYWIATAATRVLANPATYTGSIGVVASRINLKATYEKLGIGNASIKKGANADLFNDAQPLTDEQRAILTASIETNYREFVAKVATARGMAEAEVEALAAGRVWTGSQALEVGLVDELGGLNAALVAARTEAGLAPEAAATIRVYPRARSLFDQMFSFLSLASTSGARATTLMNLNADQQADAIDLATDPSARARRMDLLRRLTAGGRAWAILQGSVPVPAR